MTIHSLGAEEWWKLLIKKRMFTPCWGKITTKKSYGGSMNEGALLYLYSTHTHTAWGQSNFLKTWASTPLFRPSRSKIIHLLTFDGMASEHVNWGVDIVRTFNKLSKFMNHFSHQFHILSNRKFPHSSKDGVWAWLLSWHMNGFLKVQNDLDLVRSNTNKSKRRIQKRDYIPQYGISPGSAKREGF